MFSPFRLLLFALLLGGPLALSAQENAPTDPGDVYFQGWLLSREATKLTEQNQPLAARKKFQQAQELFLGIQRTHPEWKKDMLAQRLHRIETHLATLQAAAQQAEATQKAHPNPLVPAEETTPRLASSSSPPPRATPSRSNTRQHRQEIARLRQQLSRLDNQRNLEAARLRRRVQELESAQSREISEPVRRQLESLGSQIKDLTAERQTLSTDLLRTRLSLRKSQLALEETQRELADSRQKEAELQRTLEEQRQVNFEVIKGQQQQLAALREQLQAKNQLLSQSDQKIRELHDQLTSSEGLIAELTQERDALLKERDQMAALLDLNSADRLQELINQNVRLSRELNKAQERIEVLDTDTNDTKDQLIEARRALAVAKARILNLQEESQSRHKRLTQLKEELRIAQLDLAAQDQDPTSNAASREEARTLRAIIDKLQNSLRRQEETRELLLAQAQREGQKNPEWLAAVEQLQGQSHPELTLEEQTLIAQDPADIAMVNRYRPSAQERLEAGARLQETKKVYNGLARRAFASGKLPVAASCFETIIEEDPGDWRAMLNLGIVRFEQSQPVPAAQSLRQAILFKGEKTLPRAHYLLGVCLYQTAQLDEAAQHMQTAAELEPTQAHPHIYLGNIAGDQNRLREAQKHFEKALTLDPSLNEPHLNLAVLLARQGRLKEALTHYREALKRGAAPRPALEARLKKSS